MRGGVAAAAARTQVHRGDEHEPGREDDAARGARDRDEAVLERLAQRFENRTVKLGELVEKEHSTMREARLAGAQVRAAADDRGGRRAVVRRAERRPRDERLLAVDQPGDRVDPCHLERRLGVERRQDPRQPAGKHRLSRPGRPAEEDVVAARGRELERATSALTSDVGEVGPRRPAGPVRWQRRLGLQPQLAAQVRDRLGEVANRDRGDAGERSLPRGVRGAEQTLGAEPARAFGNRQHAAHVAKASVERELPDRGGARERAPRELLRRGEQRERDRQVEAGALLAQLGRREIDRDPTRREVELRRGDPRPDTLTGFLASTVGQPDDREARQAVANVRLDVDPTRLEADERMRDRACKHAARL